MNALTPPTLIFSSASLVTAIFTSIYAKTFSQQLWGIFNLIIAGWGLALFMVSLSYDPSHIIIWLRFGHFFGPLMPAVFLHFIAAFTATGYRRIYSALYAHQCLFAILVIAGFLPLTPHSYDDYMYGLGNVIYGYFIATWVGILACGLHLLYRYGIKSGSHEMQIQSRYLLASTLIGFCAGAGFHYLSVFGVYVNPAFNYLIVLYVLLSTYAIFRHRLLGFDFAVRKGLGYTVLISIITSVYAMLLLLLERTFHKSLGYDSYILTLAVFALIVAIVEPLRLFVQSAVDGYFFRGSIASIAEQRARLMDHLAKHERTKAAATLATGMAHEIKNPLTSLKTFAEFLPQKYDDPEFRAMFQRIVTQEVTRIDDTVRQLLAFAKPGDPVLRSENIHIILEETLSLLSNELIKSKIDVFRDYSAEHPDVTVDRNQMKQVFLNLFLNAMQAMKDGGQIAIHTAVESAGRMRITLEDTGTGVPEHRLPRLGEPFFTDKDGGTGLGLAVVQAIVEKHGGKIEYRNRQDRPGLSVSVVV